MPTIKCKMCGGNIQLAEDKTFGTCEYCGSVMTLPRVSDEQRAAAFNRGNHFRRAGEFDKALGVYEHIVADDDTDAEAHWCCALCRFGIEYVEDPATYEWLPTCHRASFDSFLEDVDYLAALEHSDGITRRQYQKDAAKIAEVQRGILAASQNTEPYDVFISYKELDENGERTRDSILAQEIYYRLTEKGWRVFFSRISLEDVPGTQYEPYIFAALNSAKVMVVVGTSAENLNAVWVKNEWSRFLAMMRKDRSKLLIPCYRDMDPYDLPEQLSVLMSYDMGKIGFIQDLIRGVDKVLGAEKKEHEPVKETVKETVVVQQGGGPNVTALLKRGQQALEDGDWDRAKEYFDRVLDMDAENSDAFFGLFLAGAECGNEDVYIRRACAKEAQAEKLSIQPATERIRKAVKQFTVKDYLSEQEIQNLFQYDLSYTSTLKAQQRLAAGEKQTAEQDRNLSRAIRYAKNDEAAARRFKARLFAELDAAVKKAKEREAAAREKKQQNYEDFLTAAEKKAEAEANKAMERQEADRQKELAEREEAYQSALRLFEQAKSQTDYQSAKDSFLALVPYKDSAEMAKRCDEKMAQIKQAEAEEAERQRIAKDKAEKAVRAKKKRLTIAAILAVVMVVAGYFTYTKRRYAEDRKEWLDACHTVGSTVTFGNYEQDNDTSNGKEPIEWIVLDVKDDRSLLISKYALDCQPYNNGSDDMPWATCTLREWLNREFLKAAFNEEELAMIPTVTVNANKNQNQADADKAVQDKVFLLDSYKATVYLLRVKEVQKCMATAYAVAQGVAQGARSYDQYQVNGKDDFIWWLREDDTTFTSVVIRDGIYDYFDDIGIEAVRPALWIELDRDSFTLK